MPPSGSRSLAHGPTREPIAKRNNQYCQGNWRWWKKLLPHRPSAISRVSGPKGPPSPFSTPRSTTALTSLILPPSSLIIRDSSSSLQPQTSSLKSQDSSLIPPLPPLSPQHSVLSPFFSALSTFFSSPTLISQDPPAGPPSEKTALIVPGDFCFNSLTSETPTNRKDFLHVC